jgi:hypothetical protein
LQTTGNTRDSHEWRCFKKMRNRNIRDSEPKTQVGYPESTLRNRHSGQSPITAFSCLIYPSVFAHSVAIPHISASPHRSGPRGAATLICRTFVRGSLGTIMSETGGRGKEKEGCWLTIEPRNTRTTRKMIQRRDLQVYLNSLQLHGAPLQRNYWPTARDFADSLACLRVVRVFRG